jgi:hypothetical protein
MKFIERHFEVFDAICSVGAAATLSFFLHRNNDQLLKSLLLDIRPILYPLIAGVFATFFSFGMAALSIVLGFSNSGRLDLIRGSRQWPTLWRVFVTAMWSSLLCSALAITTLVMDKERSTFPLFSYATLLATLFGFTKVYRLVWAFSKIVQIIVRRIPIEEAYEEEHQDLVAH